MGLGPPILALYRQLQAQGAFDGINSVLEMGAQAVWCPKPQLVASLFDAFGRPPPSAEMLDRFANWKGSARELHEALGHTYRCVDVDPSFDSIRMDLNFDPTPPDEIGRYDFVTNHGTSEHLLNQFNFFKVMHEFARPGGLFIHAVPFTVHVEHGFFNYQPNFFSALARYNSYETLGMWVGPDWQLASLVPWEHGLIDYLTLNSKTTHLLVVLQRKRFDTPFAVPFQEVYEEMIPEEAYARYSMVVDGEVLDGKRVKYLSRRLLEADRLAAQAAAMVAAATPAPMSPAHPSAPLVAAPSAASLDGIGGRVLLREVARRIRQRLRAFVSLQ